MTRFEFRYNLKYCADGRKRSETDRARERESERESHFHKSDG